MPSFRVVAYPRQQQEDETNSSGRLSLAPSPAQTTPKPVRHLRSVARKQEIRRGQSEDDVEQQLIGEGYQVASITPVERIASWKTKFRSEKIVLYRHLARVVRKSTMINLADDFLPMFKATSPFREHARDFLRAIESQPIYKAMSAKPAVFADYEVNIMEMGANGNEGEMLEMLADSLKLEVRIGRWGKQLAVYPSILLAIIVLAVVVFYTVALPKLLVNVTVPQYSELPLYMQAIMLPTQLFGSWISGMLTGIALALVALLAIAAYLFIPPIQYAAEYALLTMTGPYGKILTTGLQLRFLTILRLMLRNGQADRAYDVVQGVAIGRVAQKALRRIKAAYEEGQASWASAMYHGSPLLERPLVGRIVAAERNDATIGMTNELTELVQEKEQDGDILFEDLKTKLNASMILSFAVVIVFMYLSLYATSQFFLTHAR